MARAYPADHEPSKLTFFYTRPPLQSAASTLPLGGRAKRLLDLIAASSALLLVLPLFLLIAALIKLSDGGPIFYSHRRIGYNSRLFACLKFRTMVPNAENVLPEHLRASPQAAREWCETRKLKRDPRVTVIGSVLRQLSIDELPQLINVLRGEMSLVGPRPIVAEELEFYGEDAVLYLRARPGVTGAWQISGRNDLSYEQRVAFDRLYVESWSLWTDLVIIVRTIPAVLLAKGSY
jgi:exopolysaccharide production protein ExoY